MPVHLTLVLALALPLAEGTHDRAQEVEALLAVIDTNDEGPSWRAVDTLAAIGAPAVPAIRRFISAPHHDTPGMSKQAARYHALLALGRMKKGQAKDAVDDLLSILRDSRGDESVRWAAASALGGIGARPREVVPALERVVADPTFRHSSLRFYAIAALAEFGPAAGSALPTLRRVHAEEGGGAGFARAFRLIEGLSSERERQEDDIREAVVRHLLEGETNSWCLEGDSAVSVRPRVRDLPITESSDACSELATPEPTASGGRQVDRIVSRRALRIDFIDWLTDTEVVVGVRYWANHTHPPTSTHSLRRSGGIWVVFRSYGGPHATMKY